ncbi:hypothetical protein LX81_03166 [Palleronia aestuarii]|uniref:Uncharacterized protein n=1 Tax=Palleronia aestuarii TaxID=568105 RepID=A0A2W7N5R4_9RHOB|nr:hypothetical protein [Palleronia aestuarii]PZX13617.1 hypothetical protein LX81_03166 [Palleronia aestuarii]
MPLDRFVLILVCVIGAAGLTIWLGAIVSASFAFPMGWFALVPTLLVLYVLWRVVSDRLRSAEDDRYDRTKR